MLKDFISVHGRLGIPLNLVSCGLLIPDWPSNSGYAVFTVELGVCASPTHIVHTFAILHVCPSSSARPRFVPGALIGGMTKLHVVLSAGQLHLYLLSLIPTFSSCPPLSRSLQSIDFHGYSSWMLFMGDGICVVQSSGQ